MAEWAEKKKKSNWEGQPMGPGTTALLGRLVEWVVVVMLRGCGRRQGRNAGTMLCFRKDQALAHVSSVALGLYTVSTLPSLVVPASCRKTTQT